MEHIWLFAVFWTNQLQSFLESYVCSGPFGASSVWSRNFMLMYVIYVFWTIV
uniref:Uncharacterized protein n=1 Tax=Aegilops tauschii subsp. strangulata TaxID=200361 RepID=A0A453T5Y3_AEGTS